MAEVMKWFGAKENIIYHCFHFSPYICHEVMGLNAMILVFWMLSFKPAFSLSFFTFIKRLFSSSLFSAIRVMSSVYLWLLIFLLAILIPVCASYSMIFCMMYSAYKYSAKTRWGADCGLDHELVIAKFRLKLTKVGKSTRPSDVI